MQNKPGTVWEGNMAGYKPQNLQTKRPPTIKRSSSLNKRSQFVVKLLRRSLECIWYGNFEGTLRCLHLLWTVLSASVDNDTICNIEDEAV